MIAPIARWFLWESVPAADGLSIQPDVSFVEPLLRRRLSPLARMALRVAYDCAHDIPGVRFVYASRHGELTRTTAMLETMADDGDLSPALFSLSVLNAVTGLYSMLQKNVAPATALSAGAASFGYGLLEACLQHASNPEQAVLYVYADEPAPAIYGEVDPAANSAHAIGLLLQSSAGQRVRCDIAETPAVDDEAMQSRAFLRCLESGRADWSGNGKTWTWELEVQ